MTEIIEEMEIGEVESKSKALAVPEERSAVKLEEAQLVLSDPSGQDVLISRDQFMAYYVPGATKEELFHCFHQTRVTGLNPAIPGQCHYFRTADKPMRLFVGYEVYIKKAQEEGDLLTIVSPPDIEVDLETGLPIKCIITLKFKSDRPDLAWPTWFSEVAGRSKGNLNARWQRAPFQMLIKCAIVNALRISGEVNFMPYIPEEIDSEPTAGPYRSIPEATVESYTEPVVDLPESTQDITPGEVTATTHQIDFTPLRKAYFGLCKGNKEKKIAGIIPDDDERRAYQQKIVGKESTSDFDEEDYSAMFEALHFYQPEVEVISDAAEPDPDPHTEEIEQATDQALEELAESFPTDSESSILGEAKKRLAEYANKAFPNVRAAHDWIYETFNKNAADLNLGELSDATAKVIAMLRDKTDQEPDWITEETIENIKIAVMNDTDPKTKLPRLINMNSKLFRNFAYDVICHKYNSIKSLREEEGLMILERLKDDSDSAEAASMPDEESEDVPESSAEALVGKPESQQDPTDVELMTDEQFQEMKETVKFMPERYHQSIASEMFKWFVFDITKRKTDSLRELTESDASDVILAMQDMAQDEANKSVEQINKPKVV